MTAPDAPHPPLPVDLYRGSANTWECDEMGHLNVRFYVARAMEGLAILAHAMGMRAAFAVGAAATLTPVDQHIRFLKEVRPGQPLRMRGGVVAMEECHAVIFQELTHADGTPAATFRTRIAHMEPRDLRAFPFSNSTRAASAALACAVPAHGAPRSLSLDAPWGEASLARADALSVPLVGRFAVTPDHLDAFGWMRPELFIGRVSDAVPNILAEWRRRAAELASPSGETRRTGGAVLEYRIAYRRWPRAGDLLEARSGVIEVAEKTHRLGHWVLDPVTGEAWATAEAVAVTFDLDTRKTIAPPAEHRAALAATAVAGMSI
ncbi:MAG: thioesterase family protein [Hyphomonadaceae bacterium]|nr:thioesterase family protein [Hyphomonadaceae bacterium]